MAEAKKKMVEPASLLVEMEEMERWNGPDWRANWFELKRRIASILQEEKNVND